MKGKKVRVKHGGHTEIMVTDEQHKHIIRNHKGGKAAEIHFSKLQQDVHRGSGFFDTLRDIGHQALPVLGELGKEAAKAAIPIAAEYAKKQVLGDGMRHRKKKHGDGFLMT